MDESTARQILYTITAMGALVWLWGLYFLSKAAREGRGGRTIEVPGERFEIGDEPTGNLIRGNAVVVGTPAKLSARAAAALAQQESSGLGLVKVLDQAEDRLLFEGMGPEVPVQASHTAPWTGLRRGELRFSPDGPGRTQIDYTVELSGGRGLLWLGGLFQALGLLALIVGFWATQRYVVQAPNLGVRAQVFQMAQVIHFLWPPFLLGHLYRGRRRAIRAGLEALVHNLPYR